MKSPSEVPRRLEVLVVNQYFPPDTAATAGTTADLVRALQASGHRVSVLCGRPSYDTSDSRRWRPLRREIQAECRIESVGSTAFDRRRLPGRVANYVSYLALAGARASGMARPDVVVSGSDPPLAVWVAHAAAHGRPVVYVVRDLHPDCALAAGWIRPGRMARTWERTHLAALHRCSTVVCLGETMADRVRAKGVPPGRVKVVPDGGRRPLGSPDPSVVAELRAGARFVAVHAGNLGSAGAWRTLVEAAASLDDGVRLVFVGDGISADVLRQQGLSVVPFLPEPDLPGVMAAGDVQIVTVAEGLDGLVVPSKLYTALAHGRPILAVAPETSEVATIVQRWGCGLVADPGDSGAVAAALSWLRDHPRALEAMSAAAREAALVYDRKTCMARLVSVIEAAAAGEAIPSAEFVAGRSPTMVGGRLTVSGAVGLRGSPGGFDA